MSWIQEKSIEDEFFDELKGILRRVLGQERRVGVFEQRMQIGILRGEIHCQECPKMLKDSLIFVYIVLASNDEFKHKLVPFDQSCSLFLEHNLHK